MRANGGHAKILLVSRGKGRGHALPDVALAEHLRVDPRVQIVFASYGTGFRTLQENGEAAHDLQMPDDNSFTNAIIQTARVTREVMPDLVVAHEEVAALIGAEICSIPSVFITDWFFDPSHLLTQCLSYAREILFIGSEGVYTEPPDLCGKIIYTGPLLRRLQYTHLDRARARSELGIPHDSVLISCLSGTTYEASTPVIDLVIGAYDLLPFENKRMIWVDEVNRAAILRKCGGRSDVLYKRVDWKLERVMVASDVVVNKGTRNILRELEALNIPSVSLSYGRNWPDDVLASKIPTNTALRASSVTPKSLSEILIQRIESHRSAPSATGGPANTTDGLQAAAQRILMHIKTLGHS